MKHARQGNHSSSLQQGGQDRVEKNGVWLNLKAAHLTKKHEGSFKVTCTCETCCRQDQRDFTLARLNIHDTITAHGRVKSLCKWSKEPKHPLASTSEVRKLSAFDKDGEGNQIWSCSAGVPLNGQFHSCEPLGCWTEPKELSLSSSKPGKLPATLSSYSMLQHATATFRRRAVQSEQSDVATRHVVEQLHGSLESTALHQRLRLEQARREFHKRQVCRETSKNFRCKKKNCSFPAKTSFPLFSQRTLFEMLPTNHRHQHPIIQRQGHVNQGIVRHHTQDNSLCCLFVEPGNCTEWQTEKQLHLFNDWGRTREQYRTLVSQAWKMHHWIHLIKKKMQCRASLICNILKCLENPLEAIWNNLNYLNLDEAL